MADKVKRVKTDAEIRAQKKYMEKFCEVKVRMTTERRTEVQEHAANMGESTTAFINRAIDETMSRDGLSDKE
ncbi:hypothetical protein D3Z58_07560 [Clostridiaceae bacterium]|nr:hypothetical protein [Lachnospiraceae bacterium]MBP3543945.1 hypothetical protein [Lachnospiraceae bacterium]NBH33415.1 hypothetical protein [Clostridiaceae bacterium]